MDRIYLDNAASTPMDPEVIAHMAQLMEKVYGNPSSIHSHGREAKNVIETARRKIASCFNASVGEIFFTSGGTESNNMILHGAAHHLGVKRVISSAMEHHAVLHCLENLSKQGHVELHYLSLDPKGRINLDELESLLQDGSQKTLVSLMHANNEIGTILPFDKISALCRQYGALFHSDTVQTVGKIQLDLKLNPASFITGSAHKFFGPKGVGFVYISSENMIPAFIHGGSQERNMRAGTENIAGIAGMAMALEKAMTERSTRTAHIQSLREAFLRLTGQLMPEVRLNGPENTDEAVASVISLSLPSTPKTDLMVFNLDIAGISASAGSACSSGVEQQSHVLQAIQADPSRRAVRISVSHLNTLEEMEKTAHVLAGMLALNPVTA